MRKQTLFILILTITAAVATGYLLVPGTPQTPEISGPVSAPATGPTPALAVTGPMPLPITSSTAETLPPLPSHLANAHPDLQLQVNAKGALIPTPDLRRLFDFFLSGLTDEPLERVLHRIEQALTGQLADSPRALAEARNLLTRYVDYRLGLDDLESASAAVRTSDGFNLEALRSRHQQLQALRATHFSAEETEVFFALDQVQDQYMLDYLSVQQNPALSEPERAQALTALEHSLPDEVRQLRQRVTRNADLYEQTRKMQQQGASGAELYQVRAQALGDEAAANLAELDQQRAQWQQRLDAFAVEQERIRQSEMSPGAQRAAIEQLISSEFSGTEALRVRALAPEL
ncbi:MAG: lipase secretion chaperone [Marinobacter sp.]|uniref:lipase secretion chaperone n=1 Tax=Marinobacter sp. TaxID=50741 RepID=UPI00299DD43B|nr:lipase secretion chaperone [Marinobacter sp.]MDX1756084.1 lipase secretion chaperone [Marinobacter sp.]